MNSPRIKFLSATHPQSAAHPMRLIDVPKSLISQQSHTSANMMNRSPRDQTEQRNLEQYAASNPEKMRQQRSSFMIRQESIHLSLYPCATHIVALRNESHTTSTTSSFLVNLCPRDNGKGHRTCVHVCVEQLETRPKCARWCVLARDTWINPVIFVLGVQIGKWLCGKGNVWRMLNGGIYEKIFLRAECTKMRRCASSFADRCSPMSLMFSATIVVDPENQ